MKRIAIVIFAFALPFGALADVTGTATLQANKALNLDSGATVDSGGDILWNGSSLVPQGKATAYAVAALGLIGFNNEAESVLMGLKFLSSAAPIPASKLPVDELVAVYTRPAMLSRRAVASSII